MSKTTARQRMLRSGQPYTVITRVPAFETDEQGNVSGVRRDEQGRIVRVNQVTGHTLEDRHIEATEENPDGEWTKVWEPHDLGQTATLKAAGETAEAWRLSLVGNYPVGP